MRLESIRVGCDVHVYHSRNQVIYQDSWNRKLNMEPVPFRKAADELMAAEYGSSVNMEGGETVTLETVDSPQGSGLAVGWRSSGAHWWRYSRWRGLLELGLWSACSKSRCKIVTLSSLSQCMKRFESVVDSTLIAHVFGCQLGYVHLCCVDPSLNYYAQASR